MLEKLQFLENRNEMIKVKEIYSIKKCTTDSHGTLVEQGRRRIKSIGEIDIHYKKFIALGKELYELNKNKIGILEYRNGVSSFLLANLIIENIDSKSLEIVKKWVENNPICLIDIDQSYDKIETEILIDLSIFSYLVNSSLNNYYNKDFSNEISFETFTNLKYDNLFAFYELISIVMQTYEMHTKLKEQTEITYNNKSSKLETIRVYENIYSLYWFILKMQLLCFSNGYKFINLCSCGNVIIGRSERCESCKLAWDAFRKREQRKNKV